MRERGRQGEKERRATQDMASPIGNRITLVSVSKIRYEGVLVAVQPREVDGFSAGCSNARHGGATEQVKRSCQTTRFTASLSFA